MAPGPGKFGSRSREELFCRSAIPGFGGGGANLWIAGAECFALRGTVFRARLDSRACGNFRANCHMLPSGSGRRDALFPALLLDAAAGGMHFCVHDFAL